MLLVGWALLAVSATSGGAEQVKSRFDAVWLRPEVVQSGKSMRVYVESGLALRARATKPGDFSPEWLFVRTEATQWNLEAPEATLDAGGSIGSPLASDTVHRVGVDLRVEQATVDSIDFESANRRLSATWIGPASASRIRAGDRIVVRHARSASAILRLPGTGAPSPVATAKTGQAAEIRPLMDPTALDPGSDLPFRLYAGGSPVAGARVLGTPPSGEPVLSNRTDSAGIGSIRVSRSGRWRLEFHVARLDKAPGNDVTLFSGTLVFEVRKEAEGPGR